MQAVFRLFLSYNQLPEMKKLILCFLVMLLGAGAFSQRVYFVYLQTEQEQPFFVKMNNQIYSSAASGYLILPKLHDSTYSFSVGFPQNKWLEQNFSIIIGAKDHGYLVKNFGDKGWGLYDLQTMTLQMAVTNLKINEEKPNQANNSAFTEILAKATGDSTLNQKPEVQRTVEKKMITVDQPSVVVNDTVLKKSTESNISVTENKNLQTVIKNEETKKLPNETYKRSTIIRKSESSTTAGFALVFIDDYGPGKDTIKILIPELIQTTKKAEEGKKADVKFLDIVIDTTQVPVNSTVSVKQSGDIIRNTTLPADSMLSRAAFGNKCIAIANDNDFFELRKKMAASNGDDEMVDTAKKYFKIKCYSTAQLRNLSTLFLNDDGKYKFFDAAYNYVSDKENFDSLQSEMKDSYYINRFKAMLRN